MSTPFAFDTEFDADGAVGGVFVQGADRTEEVRAAQRQKLLVERNEMAHTEDFTLVAAPGMNPGSLVEVSIGGHNGRHLTIASAAASAAA